MDYVRAATLALLQMTVFVVCQCNRESFKDNIMPVDKYPMAATFGLLPEPEKNSASVLMSAAVNFYDFGARYVDWDDSEPCSSAPGSANGTLSAEYL
jgi:hypothetical protein